MLKDIQKTVFLFVIMLTWLFINVGSVCLSGSVKQNVHLNVLKQTKDGEIVMRNGGIIKGKEKYNVSFKSSLYAYVYIFQVDKTCALSPIFPNLKYTKTANPVATNKYYRIQGLSLDQVKGKEIIVLLASKNKMKITNVEKICQNVSNVCITRGVANTYKPEKINRNIIEIKTLSFEHR